MYTLICFLFKVLLLFCSLGIYSMFYASFFSINFSNCICNLRISFFSAQTHKYGKLNHTTKDHIHYAHKILFVLLVLKQFFFAIIQQIISINFSTIFLMVFSQIFVLFFFLIINTSRPRRYSQDLPIRISLAQVFSVKCCFQQKQEWRYETKTIYIYSFTCIVFTITWK